MSGDVRPGTMHWLLDRMEVALLVVLLAYISLVPYYNFAELSFHASLLSVVKFLPAALSVGVLVTRFPLQSSGLIEPGAGRIVALLVGFVAASGLSLLDAKFAAVGVLKLLYYTVTGIALFLAVRTCTTARVLQISWVLAALGGVVSLYGLLVFVVREDFIWGPWLYDAGTFNTSDRVSSTVGNPVMLGGYLALVTPLLAGATAILGKGPSRVLAAIATAGAVLCMVATFSRAAWLSLIFLCSTWSWRYRDRIAHRFRNTSMGPALLALLLVMQIAFLVFPESGRRLIDNAVAKVSNSGPDEANVRFRLDQYLTTVQIVGDQPFLGLGFGNYTRLFERYVDKKRTAWGPEDAHTTDNMYLMVLVETGIIGLVLFAGTLFFLLRGQWVAVSTNSHSTEAVMGFSVFTGTCAFLINILFWDGLNQPTTRIVFWVLLGVGARLAASAHSPIIAKSTQDDNE